MKKCRSKLLPTPNLLIWFFKNFNFSSCLCAHVQMWVTSFSIEILIFYVFLFIPRLLDSFMLRLCVNASHSQLNIIIFHISTLSSVGINVTWRNEWMNEVEEKYFRVFRAKKGLNYWTLIGIISVVWLLVSLLLFHFLGEWRKHFSVKNTKEQKLSFSPYKNAPPWPNCNLYFASHKLLQFNFIKNIWKSWGCFLDVGGILERITLSNQFDWHFISVSFELKYSR